MKPEDRALALMVTGTVVVVAAGEGVVYFLGAPSSSWVLVPPGVVPLQPQFYPQGNYTAQYTYSSNTTAMYVVSGTWTASGPVQIIVAMLLGLNYGGCGFYPLNVPPGPLPSGCWPAFEAAAPGAFSFSFHICVGPTLLPTGSFVVLFRSTEPASVTIVEPFVVQTSPFPVSSC